MFKPSSLSKNFYLTAFFLYQLASTALIATGGWPQWVVFVNLAVQLGAVLLFDLEYGVYSIALSIPFYLVLPKFFSDTFDAWRLVFALIFVKFLWQNFRRGVRTEYFAWDKYLKYLTIAAIFSLAVAEFKIVGIKKIVFVANIYVFYVVIYNVFHTKEQILKLVKVTLISLATIIALGYAQYISTFFAAQYYFWQYWATLISRAFYGNLFANTAAYSNSWFSYSPGQAPALRMFSIMPSSHTFAVLTIFTLPFIGGLYFFAKQRWQKICLALMVFFTVLALLLSGTRGVWAGIILPIVIVIYLYVRRFNRKFQKMAAIPIALFFILLAVSPLVHKAVDAIYHGNGIENFLQRADSIYDLSESSNKGRLMIWGDTLKYVATHPLLGSGIGNFVSTLQPVTATAAPSYDQLASQVEKNFNLPQKYITGHSLYLDILAEMGIIGLICFIFYLKSLVQNFWEFFDTHSLFIEDGLVFFVYAAALALAWMFAYSVFDGTLLDQRVLIYFFMILGCSASIIRLYRNQ